MRMHELSQLTKGRLGLHSLTPPRSKDMSVIVCPYCTDGEAFCALSDQLLEQHIRFAHLQDPGFSIECKNASCSCVFTNYQTYKNHLLPHKNAVDVEPMESNPGGQEESGELTENTSLTTIKTIWIASYTCVPLVTSLNNPTY